MIAPYVVAAIGAPLRDRPSALEAEVSFLAERDRISLFAAALDQWRREREPRPEPEFAL